MILCGVPGCINQVDENSNIITLVNNNSNVIITISPNIQNPGTFNF